jgi:transposase
VDALGNPVRLRLTEGQAHDVTQAPKLLDAISDANILGDKAYDSKAVIDALEARGCTAVIPSRVCCARQRTIDLHVYKERFLVECFFQRIKRHRRIAMRFEKLASHFLAMVSLAAILLWAL